jgi:ATPase family associated with various cellular activities (AAA)
MPASGKDAYNRRMSPVPPADLFPEALHSSFTAYRIGRALRGAWPNMTLVEGEDSTFDLDRFADAGHCARTPCLDMHIEVHTSWNAPFLAESKGDDWWTPPYVPKDAPKRGDGSLARSSANAVYNVRWEGHELVVVIATWAEGSCNHTHFWVLASEREIAETFLVAACRFGQAPRQEVLVINGERWKKDPELFASIRSSTLDDLVLPAALRNEIVEDFTTFLKARDDYARLGIPWKRGVLFLGPPGNGKTHCLRGVLGLLDLPTLYVQSFRSRHDTDERNIEEVFDRARRIAPCALVFEDLDAQITPANRSFFLNQLDGFASNAGLLVLATTNHPDRLDPAILDRPSRFDRKYHFPLPVAESRVAYLARWTERLAPELRLTPDQSMMLIERTEGFSFAYLKELCLSSVLRWMKHRTGSLFPMLESQLGVLRAQMRSDGAAEAAGPPDADA